MNPERQPNEGRLQGFDLRLAAALRDVPVPAGLADRLLARMPASAPGETLPAPAARFAVRRRTLMAVGVAAAVFVAAWMLFDRQSQPADAAELAATWYADLNAALVGQSVSWKASGKGPNSFPVPNSIRVPARGWTSVRKIVGANGVAYDLGGDGRTAVLFVVKMPADAPLPSRPPVSPQSSTGGVTIGVWQSGELRYVLVVSGEIRDYRELIDSNSAPFA